MGQSHRVTDAVSINDLYRCEVCGRHGARDWAGRSLCDDCLAAGQSCCPEFGCAEKEAPNSDA